MYSKSEVVIGYQKALESGELKLSAQEETLFKKNIQMKKVRTLSGVTPVTVLTKPYPCPGKCIFCPNDVRMPKSYLSDEPGAQRALSNKFDPYFQTFNRLVAFRNTGHPTDKLELLILGGTWSSYPTSYQIWFVKRCFDAMNDFESLYDTKTINPDLALPFDESKLEDITGENINKSYNQVISMATQNLQSLLKSESATWEELFESHKSNEVSKTKCIGLVIETRPDEINEEEVLKVRKLGATRVQIGIQSLDDNVLRLNKRGHDVAKTEHAIDLLRQAGFKILAHWMPNLYGSSSERDKEDFLRLFTNTSIKPDELKIYPCSLIESAELMKYHKDGLWNPYTEKELMDVVSFALQNTPRYCRLNRVIRDIPSTDIVVGNKKTNFRQLAEQHSNNVKLLEIRSREVKDKVLTREELCLKETVYETAVSSEYFLEFVDSYDTLAGFMRLSLPKVPNFVSDLADCAIIREIHVYGRSVEIGKKRKGSSQHQGLGTELIDRSMEIAKDHGFSKLAVISSVGTRAYYSKRGFHTKGLYQIAFI